MDTGDMRLVLLSWTGSVAHLYMGGRALLYEEMLLTFEMARL